MHNLLHCVEAMENHSILVRLLHNVGAVNKVGPWGDGKSLYFG